MTKIYTVTAPRIPGATPSLIATVTRLAMARRIAETLRDRRDLTYQDVVIARDDRRFVEFAGPCR